MNRHLRARVLRHQRCEMCGKSPMEDGVRLHVDHKLPREWGGPTEEWNLQALCSDCNEGKKAYYATFDTVAPQVMTAIEHESVHMRIGEILKAFKDRWARHACRSDRVRRRGAWSTRGTGRSGCASFATSGGASSRACTTSTASARRSGQLLEWKPWPDEGPGPAIRHVTGR